MITLMGKIMCLWIGVEANIPGTKEIAAVVMQFIQYQGEQAGFPGSVGTGNACFMAGVYLKAGFFKQQLMATS